MIAQIHDKVLNEFHLNTQFNKKDFYFPNLIQKTNIFLQFLKNSVSQIRLINPCTLIPPFLILSWVPCISVFSKISTHRPTFVAYSISFLFMDHLSVVWTLNFEMSKKDGTPIGKIFIQMKPNLTEFHSCFYFIYL